MIAILAKDYNQFKNYLASNANPDQQYIYAADANALKRVRISDYIVVGTFLERKDAGDILEQANRSLSLNKEPKVSEPKAPPNYERSLIRGITLLGVILLGSIVLGIGTCVQFDRQMERLCMERGGSWNGVVGCYQPVPLPTPAP